MSVDNKDYELAFLIREFEKKLLDLFSLGELHGTVHTCIGQEFSSVSVLKNFIKGDWAISNHRGHGHFLSVTKDVDGLMAEIMGRDSGVCRGIGGSQHLFSEGFISNGIQGGMAPIAVGMSMSQKIDKSHNIVFNFFGDGTLGEGSLYEAFNFSSKWKTPILWVLDNNGYAQSTNTNTTISGTIKDRANAFDIKYFYAEIWDLDKLFLIAEEAVNYVRNTGFPAFLEIKSYRLMAHSKGDDNRNIDEVSLYFDKDPLNVFLKKNKTFVSECEHVISSVNNAIKKGLNSDYCSYAPKHNNPFSIKVNNSYSSATNKRMSEQIYQGFIKSFNINSNLIMIGEDIEGPYGGAFNVTRGLSQKFVGRVINTPISESAIIGVATGLSLMGKQCIAEIMFGDFMTLTLDQLLQHACKFHDMYANMLNVPLIVRTPMGGGRGYGPTHSQSLEKHFLGIYGLDVVALNHRVNNESFYINLISSIKSPHLILENKILYTKTGSEYFPDAFSITYTDSLYPTIIISPPDMADVTILCYGGMLDVVEKILEELLFEYEIMVEVICPTLISSVDIEVIKKSIAKTKKILTLEEGDSYAGYSSQVITALHNENINSFKSAVMGYSGVIPACHPCEEQLLISKTDIIKKVRKMF
jgi:2-oxoisovalerate dehydrogenase E1 component